MSDKPKLIASELRIGNLHHYRVCDSMDERKEWIEICAIEPSDIDWLSNNPDDENYSPIPLSEDVLVKLGFESKFDYFTNGLLLIKFVDDDFQIKITNSGDWYINPLKYAHEIQNLNFALFKLELIYTP